MNAPDQRSEAAIAAFNEGVSDYEDGFLLRHNPYEPGECADQWQWGWEHAERLYMTEAQRNDWDEVMDDPRHNQAEDINRGR